MKFFFTLILILGLYTHASCQEVLTHQMRQVADFEFPNELSENQQVWRFSTAPVSDNTFGTTVYNNTDSVYVTENGYYAVIKKTDGKFNLCSAENRQWYVKFDTLVSIQPDSVGIVFSNLSGSGKYCEKKKSLLSGLCLYATWRSGALFLTMIL